MPFRFLARPFAVVALAALAACAQGPQQIAPDTYLVFKRSDSGDFTNASAVKADLSREASAFAQGRGQTAVPVATSELPAEPGRPARIEYRFRVVDQPGTAARRAPITAPAGAATAGGAAIAPAAPAATAAPAPAEAQRKLSPEQTKALVEDLDKLDDLRKRGIITQVEFDDLKKRILNRN